MTTELGKIVFESIPNQQKANELMNKLFDITHPDAVFSKPVAANGYTVITACELTAGLGYGYGGGGGVSPQQEGQDDGENAGYGGGGGGGGGTAARPVAAITIGPNGVEVEPIFDLTKVAIALFTAVGAIFMAASKMKKFQRTGKME